MSASEPFDPAAFVEALRVATQALAGIPGADRPKLSAITSPESLHVLAAHLGYEVNTFLYEDESKPYCIDSIFEAIHGVYVQGNRRTPTPSDIERCRANEAKRLKQSAESDIPF